MQLFKIYTLLAFFFIMNNNYFKCHLLSPHNISGWIQSEQLFSNTTFCFFCWSDTYKLETLENWKGVLKFLSWILTTFSKSNTFSITHKFLSGNLILTYSESMETKSCAETSWQKASNCNTERSNWHKVQWYQLSNS